MLGPQIAFYPSPGRETLSEPRQLLLRSWWVTTNLLYQTLLYQALGRMVGHEFSLCSTVWNRKVSCGSAERTRVKIEQPDAGESAGGGDSSPPLLFLKLVQPQPPPAAVCEQGVPVRVCGRGCRGASRARRNCSFLWNWRRWWHCFCYSARKLWTKGKLKPLRERGGGENCPNAQWFFT